uniref:Olfactory receptor n=1 Tax=Leptobrachium leishanense TaxID=445787 RepID=A0A8C5P9W5_9ANUR
MFQGNKTMVTLVVNEFVILGFNEPLGFRLPIFILLTGIYSATLTGNMMLILLVLFNHQLHCPMYFLLSHLSMSDILISTNIAPNTLQLLLAGKHVMSSISCMAQLYFFGASAVIECCLLTVMSYDRYVAICRPLHYASIMTMTLSLYLVIGSWLAGVVVSLINICLVLQLSFCGHNVIDHFFCDLAPLLDLSCSDISFVQVAVSMVAIVIGLFELIFIIITYIAIFTAIFRISTSKGRQKAFSTCSNHLSVVCTYYGTLIALYVAPSRGYSLHLNKILSLLNTLVTPLFNPIIYSLRNQEIKAAFKKLCFNGQSSNSCGHIRY